MAFVKLDCGILDSSLWRESVETKIVFITMLAMTSDDTGLCRSTAPGIAARAGVSLESACTALERLETPDPHSRTEDQDGRRIERVDGGYFIVNYAKYRAKATSEDRKEQVRRAVARHRAKSGVITCNQKKAIPSASASVFSFDVFWESWPPHKRKKGKPQCLSKWELLSEETRGKALKSLEAHKKSAGWLEEGGKFIPGPLVWLNQEGWTATPEVGTAGPQKHPAERVLKLWTAPEGER